MKSIELDSKLQLRSDWTSETQWYFTASPPKSSRFVEAPKADECPMA